MHLFNRFAHADAANSDSRQVEVGHHPCALAPQMGKASALHDAEQGLIFPIVGLNAALQPGMGAPAGIDHIVLGSRVRGALIKGHGHIGAEGHLNVRCMLRCHVDDSTVPGIAEHHTAVVDLVQVPEAEHLKATGIGEHRAVPAHESVQAAGSGDDLFAGLQMEVVSVRKHHLSACAHQLLGADPFDCGQGAHGHEPRGRHGAMGCVEAATPGSCMGATGRDVEAEQSRITTGLNLR